MNKAELEEAIKMNLGIQDKNLVISDAITLSLEYCNLSDDNIPPNIEPVIRRKAKSIIEYEAKLSANPMLNASIYDVKSISEGDSSISYNVDDNNSKESIYDITEADKRALRKFRRLRR